jgi:indole-3-glycerol phosphate synthase
MKTLEEISQDAISAVESGYYDYSPSKETTQDKPRHPNPNSGGVASAIRRAKGRALICEVKFASPSAGTIREQGSVRDIVREMEAGGAIALSILTESKNFGGSISNLAEARNVSALPIIMKDIIVSKEQIVAAKKLGANAVLFIEEVYSEGLSRGNLSLDDAIEFARDLGLDTIVETHAAEGLQKISNTRADILGINNRDLRTFQTDIETTFNLLKGFTRASQSGQLIVSESGFESVDDIRSILARLRGSTSAVPDAFLIGTSIMRSKNIRQKVQSFIEGLAV